MKNAGYIIALGLGAVALYLYFKLGGSFSASGSQSEDLSSADIAPGSENNNSDTTGGIAKGVSYGTAGGAVIIPNNIVSNVPAGVVRNGLGGTEGLLVKGPTSSVFIVPGAKQTASFMNKVIASGKTFPLNQGLSTNKTAIKNRSGR